MNNFEFKFFSSSSGVSDGVFKSLNCHKDSGDSSVNIELNRKIVCNSFSEENQLFLGKQTHSDKIFNLTNEDDLKKSDLIECDGIVTNLNNVLVGVLTADCLPILLYDEKANVIATCHGGWRGVYSELFINLFDLLKNYYNSKIENIKIWIGPAIQQKSYILGKEFLEKWIEQSKEFERFFCKKDENYYFDLAGSAIFKMIKLGILKDNIHDSKIDTFSNLNYFSYRRTFQSNKNCGNEFGRNISVIMKRTS